MVGHRVEQSSADDGGGIVPPAETPVHGRIVAILGPTASGKTDLSIRLAEKFDGEIVNADSVQIYRRLDIGTAKPDPEQRTRVRHHLIDIVEPTEPFTASDFRRVAERAIVDILERGKRVFVVGGTGLYLRALLQGLAGSPGGDESLRNELREFARREGGEELHRRLELVDPATACRLHVNDQLRIIRALEVFHQTGVPLSKFHAEHGFSGAAYTPLEIGIQVDRQTLYRRIEERIDGMMAAGFVTEVQGLLDDGFDPGLKAMRSIGYREITAFLRGEFDLSTATELIKRNTRRYAKRQLTWFKSDPKINWLEYPDNFATICNHVIDFYS